MVRKKGLRFLGRALLASFLGWVLWHWLGAFPQPVFLTWSDFQIHTTFRFATFFCLIFLVLFIVLIKGARGFLKKIGLYREASFLKALFQGIAAHALEETAQVQKSVKTLSNKHIQTPLVPWFNLILKEKTDASKTGDILALRHFPEAIPLATRFAIEEAIQKQDQEDVWTLFIGAFEEGQKNPWFLKKFFEEALNRKDLAWATRLFHKLRKLHLPPAILKSFKAEIILCQADSHRDDPLHREFLLWRAYELSPGTPSVTLSLLKVLAQKKKENKFFKCVQEAWDLSSNVVFAVALLRFFQQEPARFRFQKIQILLGNWREEKKERLFVSALVSGYAAALGGLETSISEALNYLEGERPLWAAFLRVCTLQNHQELSPEIQKKCELVIKELQKSDSVLQNLTEEPLF